MVHLSQYNIFSRKLVNFPDWCFILINYILFLYLYLLKFTDILYSLMFQCCLLNHNSFAKFTADAWWFYFLCHLLKLKPWDVPFMLHTNILCFSKWICPKLFWTVLFITTNKYQIFSWACFHEHSLLFEKCLLFVSSSLNTSFWFNDYPRARQVRVGSIFQIAGYADIHGKTLAWPPNANKRLYRDGPRKFEPFILLILFNKWLCFSF